MERLTKREVNYCEEVCRSETCKLLRSSRKEMELCDDAKIYNKLRWYEDLAEDGRLYAIMKIPKHKQEQEE